jgi:hypothetical protein
MNRMAIEFPKSPAGGFITLLEWAEQTQATLSPQDVKRAVADWADGLESALDGLVDQSVTFFPQDAAAEGGYGWNLAHIILHVTAGMEEGTCVSSILARGIVLDDPRQRLRYEPDWESFTSHDQVMARIRESRRMCLAYLDAWPDRPHLGNSRRFPESISFKGHINCIGTVLVSLNHAVSHTAQIEDAVRQAKGL